MNRFEYRSWKLHFAVIILSMIVTAIIVALGILVFGFDPACLLLIPLIPVIVYGTTLGLGLLITVGGLGAIGYFGWYVLRYFYREITDFFEDSETHDEFHWSRYFRVAFYLLLFWSLIVGAMVIIVVAIYALVRMPSRT